MTATSIFALILATQAAPVRDPPAPQIAPPPLPRPMPPMISPPPPPAPSRFSPPQRARANLGSYFSGDDYPPAAARRKEEGMVGFRLVIGANGRVADCLVIRTSGFTALDSATCRIMRSRARYRPARDYLGNAVSGSDWGRVIWRLPEDPFDPSLEASASARGPLVATPKPPRPPAGAGRRARPRAPGK